MMETGYLIGRLILAFAWSLIWGFATAGVRDRKGYGRNWFWFGFFLGLVPFIIACAIPERKTESDFSGEVERLLCVNGSSEPKQSVFAGGEYVQQTVEAGGWQCICGRANPGYVSTCSCGRNKRQNDASGQDYAAKAAARAEMQQSIDSELKKLAMLLDAQVITQEEYESGVRSLLGKK